MSVTVLHKSLYRSLLRAARPIDSHSACRASLVTSSFLRSRVPLSWFLSPTVATSQTCTALVKSHYRSHKVDQDGQGISRAFQTLRHLNATSDADADADATSPLTDALHRLQQSAWGVAIQQVKSSSSSSSSSSITTCPAADELSSPNLIMVAATHEDSDDIRRIISLTSSSSMNLTPAQRTRLAAETHLIHDVIQASYDTIQTMDAPDLVTSTLPRLIHELYHIILSAGVRPDVDTLELLMLTSLHISDTFPQQLMFDIRAMGLPLSLQLYNNYIYTLCHNTTSSPYHVLTSIQSVISEMKSVSTLPDAATFAMLYQYACIHHTYPNLLTTVLDMATQHRVTPQQIIAAIPQYQQQQWISTETTSSTDRPTTSS